MRMHMEQPAKESGIEAQAIREPALIIALSRISGGEKATHAAIERAAHDGSVARKKIMLEGKKAAAQAVLDAFSSDMLRALKTVPPKDESPNVPSELMWNVGSSAVHADKARMHLRHPHEEAPHHS